VRREPRRTRPQPVLLLAVARQRDEQDAAQPGKRP
jgi:hypothetical protein